MKPSLLLVRVVQHPNPRVCGGALSERVMVSANGAVELIVQDFLSRTIDPELYVEVKSWLDSRLARGDCATVLVGHDHDLDCESALLLDEGPPRTAGSMMAAFFKSELFAQIRSRVAVIPIKRGEAFFFDFDGELNDTFEGLVSEIADFFELMEEPRSRFEYLFESRSLMQSEAIAAFRRIAALSGLADEV